MAYEKDIEIVKSFIHTKPWRKTEDQKSKWDTLVNELSTYYKVISPKLTIDDKCETPYYSFMTNEITLNKFSVISLLHEFAHHLEYNNIIIRTNAWDYSQQVFFAAYPKAKEKLVLMENGYWRKLK